MAHQPIDRENRDDLLKQIGRVEIDIQNLDKQRGQIDKQLKSIPKRVEYLKSMNTRLSDKISKKKQYLNQLENDLSKL